MNISFRELKDQDSEYNMLHNWCSKKHVYEWFEQRILSLDEIEKKYKNKLESNNQALLIIEYNNIDIGLVQIYKFNNDINFNSTYNNIYEYDIFIGEEEYLSKGIGTIIVNLVNEMIYEKYNADAIILRPFKRNKRAISCYQKCGFKVVGEYNGFDTLNNPEIITILISTK